MAATIPLRQNARAGIGMMTLGIAVFSLSDAAGKHLVGHLTVPEIVLLRGVAALAVLAPLLRRLFAQSGWRALAHPRTQLARGVLSTAESFLFFIAIQHLPLADALTYYLAGPIVATLLAALFLGEHLSRARILGLAIGFAGVLIALAPGSAVFSPYALVSLAGCLCFAMLMVVTRKVRDTPDTILLAVQLAGNVVIGAAIVPFSWTPPSAGDLGLLFGTGIISLGAYACVNRSLRLAEASVVTPFQYTLIAWASLFGWVFFDQLPSSRIVLGAAIIIAAGLLILRAEAPPRPTRDAAAARRAEIPPGAASRSASEAS